MKWKGWFLLMGIGAICLAGCKRSEKPQPAKPEAGATTPSTHGHADGSVHEDHAPTGHAKEDDHGHDEVPIGSVTIGDLKVRLAQGHGKVQAGKESHLVVRLPYSDKGQTIVRAWLGTSDRLQSLVGKGTYAPSHDDYDIHATAPSPLPEGVMWWIEIEKPDGTKLVGSAKPLLE